MNADTRVPLYVVTGFLGSGKTTLINRLLGHPGMADTALVINELGEIAIDHALVETAFDDIALLTGGCICCTARGDVADTVGDLFAKAQAGKIPPFSRVLVETTGLADPAPVVQALTADGRVGARCRVAGVIATVDGEHAARQIAGHDEAARQVAMADVALVTKTDRVGAAATAGVAALLERLQPGLAVRPVARGEIAPAELFAAAAAGRVFVAAPGGHDHDHANHAGIAAHGIVADAPLEWDRLRRWLEVLFSLRGERLLRLKAILDVQGHDRPVVLHAVGPAFLPPERLARWPGGDRRSRLVVIARDVSGPAIERSFDALVGSRNPSLRPL